MAENRNNQQNRGGSQQNREKLNLNEASKEQLASSVEGVGDDVAEDIVRYREENGGIQDFQDLRNIGGIDDEMQSKIENSTRL